MNYYSTTRESSGARALERNQSCPSVPTRYRAGLRFICAQHRHILRASAIYQRDLQPYTTPSDNFLLLFFFFSLYIFFLPHEEINYANSWAWLCVQVDAWRRKIEVTVQRRIYRGTYRESDLARALSTRPEPRTLGARVFSCETQVGRGGRIDAHSIRGKVPRTSLHLRSQRSAVTQRRCYWTRGKLLASAVLSRQGSSVHPVNRGSDDKVGEKNLAKNWFFFLIRSGWEDCQKIKKLLIFNDLYTSRITARKKFIRIEGNFVCFYFS